jgi:hypothetical protein
MHWSTPACGVPQSRLMSLVEAVANVVVGYGVAVVTQLLVFPAFGLHATLGQDLAIGLIFTVVSLAEQHAAACVRGDPGPLCAVNARSDSGRPGELRSDATAKSNSARWPDRAVSGLPESPRALRIRRGRPLSGLVSISAVPRSHMTVKYSGVPSYDTAADARGRLHGAHAEGPADFPAGVVEAPALDQTGVLEG